MTAGQLLKKTTAIVRSMNLVLVEMVWSILRSQENCLNQENQKVKKYLSLEIQLN